MTFETWLARAGIIVISTLSAGCPPIPEITAVGPEMGPPTCDEAALASGSSHFYVINLLWMAGVEGDAPPFTSAGFDLDGDREVACNGHIPGESAEFAGQEPDNGSGIDNAFGGELGNIANASLQRDIDAGSSVLLVEVRGVDDLLWDSCVGVNIFPGALLAGTTVPETDGAGHLAAGQHFDFLPATFASFARIVAGRVQAGPSDVALALPLLGPDFPLLHVRAPQLRFDISATGVSLGVLGGSLDTEEVIVAATGFPDDRGIITDLREFRLDADLDENGSPGTCEAGSIALQFGGVTAFGGP